MTLQETRRSGRLRTTVPHLHALFARSTSTAALARRMTALKLEDGVRELLETVLDSFEKLEVARVLCTAARPMSFAEIEAAGWISPDALEEAVSSLKRAELIVSDAANGKLRLGAAAGEPSFARLMQLYRDDGASVLAVLSSMIVQRLRTMTARAFANAFVIRKKRGPDG